MLWNTLVVAERPHITTNNKAGKGGDSYRATNPHSNPINRFEPAKHLKFQTLRVNRFPPPRTAFSAWLSRRTIGHGFEKESGIVLGIYCSVLVSYQHVSRREAAFSVVFSCPINVCLGSHSEAFCTGCDEGKGMTCAQRTRMAHNDRSNYKREEKGKERRNNSIH